MVSTDTYYDDSPTQKPQHWRGVSCNPTRQCMMPRLLNCSLYAFLKFIYRFPNILINHLYLNLRAMNTTSASRECTIPKPAFAQNRVLGNIGAPIDRDPDWWNSPCDDDEDGQSDPQVSVAPSGSEGITTLVPVVSLPTPFSSFISRLVLTQICRYMMEMIL